MGHVHGTAHPFIDCIAPNCDKSFRNRHVIENFGGVLVLSHCLFTVSVGIGLFSFSFLSH